MTANALNGNALNETRFPGAEEGLSLVEMLGTVEATASISALTLRLTASAVTVGAASASSAGFKFRLQSVGDTTAQAVVAAAPQSKISLLPSSCVAQAEVAATAIVYRRVGGSGTNVATTSVSSYNRAQRGASVQAQAVGAVGARRYMPFAAGATATATAQAAALRKVFRAASGAGTATAVASLTFRRGVVASTDALASAVASTAGLKRRTGASGAGDALASANAVVRVLAFPQPVTAQAQVAVVYAQQLLNAGGAVATPTATVQSGVRMRFSTGAATTAQAVASSGAEDYGLLINAPVERTMIVPASDRRMEVML